MSKNSEKYLCGEMPASNQSTEDYYFDNGRLVFTAFYLAKRGYCCGSGCRHCPYLPKHSKGNNQLAAVPTSK